MKTTKPAVAVYVRWWIRADLETVLDIERKSFESPMGQEELLDQMRQNQMIMMVAEVAGQVVGYSMHELRKRSIRIVSLAVHPRFRERGVASALVYKLHEKLSSHRRTSLSAIVAETNVTAQIFLRNRGLACHRIMHGYFKDTHEDAYFMRYIMPQARALDDDE